MHFDFFFQIIFSFVLRVEHKILIIVNVFAPVMIESQEVDVRRCVVLHNQKNKVKWNTDLTLYAASFYDIYLFTFSVFFLCSFSSSLRLFISLFRFHEMFQYYGYDFVYVAWAKDFCVSFPCNVKIKTTMSEGKLVFTVFWSYHIVLVFDLLFLYFVSMWSGQHTTV